MKETTVHSLVIAKTLFEKAYELCLSDDRYLASAGLVVLQDALEIVFYALLIERGADENKNLERISFDELIGELRKADVGVPKSGTLKALNKQRVLTKHYAQIAEPATVRNYLHSAQQALEGTVKSVVGRSLADIYLSDLLEKTEARDFLKSAEECIAELRFLDALTETRKAIFVEFEADYSVYGWRDHEGGEPKNPFVAYMFGGWKAPYWTCNKKWIAENVKEPLDFIQIDYDRWRLDAMEWGINTAELQNIRELTPEVFRADASSGWCIKYHVDFPANEATLASAKYCLDRTIAVILRKQEHQRTRRSRSRGRSFAPPPIYLGDNVYKTASTASEVIHVISGDFEYDRSEIVSGFDPKERFFRITASPNEEDAKYIRPRNWVTGFLLIRDEENG
jgi:hypothetical protein